MPDYELTWTQRIRSEETADRFKRAVDNLEERTGNYSKQKTGLWLMKLGLQRLEDLEDRKQKINKEIP